ncbi:MAG: adenine deaminase [Deltaproteobacteria bacterium]|nr:adenine deaminase [Deltaproteobacteria bacterium]
MSLSKVLANRVDAAMGRIPCDVLFKNCNFLDVFSCQWRSGEIGVVGGMVVGLEAGLKGKREIDLKGKKIVPGFIDAHVHIESSCLIPSNFESVVLSKGTTTAICDPHELANVCGLYGIEYFLSAAEKMKMDLRVMLSSCVPSTHMETNGGGVLNSQDLQKLSSHPKVLGLAEMMNMPGVIHNDPEVLKKLTQFSDTNIDGHCPLLSGGNLSAYAAAGITTCHESSQLEEAREKLIKGMKVWIREGSVAKDLKTLIPLLNLATSTRIGFCTDDRNPLDIAHEGHLDHLLRMAIMSGVSPEVAYRSASLSVANHYGLDRGFYRKGAIAPGFVADIVILEDAASCTIDDVWVRGERVSELEKSPNPKTEATQTVKAKVPEIQDLKGPEGRVHIIRVSPGKIITGREVGDTSQLGVAKLSVLERYGQGSKPANGYVRGFGENLKGAIASSVGHDSHNLIVVGSNLFDMQVALKALIESQGGFVVVQNKSVLAHLALPLGGLMSEKNPEVIAKSLLELREASRHIGCSMVEPFLQLAFLSLPVIPSLKLTDRGLVDVEQFKIISVSAA